MQFVIKMRWFLGVLAVQRKAAVSFVMSIRQSARNSLALTARI